MRARGQSYHRLHRIACAQEENCTGVEWRVIIAAKKIHSAFNSDSGLKSVAHFVTNKMMTVRPLFHHISEVP
jgi:hypothetical protein